MLIINGLKELKDKGRIELQQISDCLEKNGHLFYIMVGNIKERTDLIKFLKKTKCQHSLSFYYISLHTSIDGKKYGKFFD